MHNPRERCPLPAVRTFVLLTLLSSGCTAERAVPVAMDLPRLSCPDLQPLPARGDYAELAVVCENDRMLVEKCKEAIEDYNRYATEAEKLGK